MGQGQAPKQFAPPQALGMPTKQDIVSPMQAPEMNPLNPLPFVQMEFPQVISPNSVGKQQEPIFGGPLTYNNPTFNNPAAGQSRALPDQMTKLSNTRGIR